MSGKNKQLLQRILLAQRTAPIVLAHAPYARKRSGILQMTTRSVGKRLLSAWGTLSPLPGGKWLFSRVLGFTIPYTGSIGAHVDHLEPGHSRIILKDRRRVRNHLRSIHAIALANVAELSTGLAVLSGMPTGYNGILTGLNVEYTKKARGTLCIECRCEVPEFVERSEIEVETEIIDELGDTVTTATARWLVGPIKSDQEESGRARAAP